MGRGGTANSPDAINRVHDRVESGVGLVLGSNPFNRPEKERNIFEHNGKYYYKDDKTGQTRRWLTDEQWETFERMCTHNIRPSLIYAQFNVIADTMKSMIADKYSDFLPDGTYVEATLDSCYAHFQSTNALHMYDHTRNMAIGASEGDSTALKMYLKMSGIYDVDKKEDTSTEDAVNKALGTIKDIIHGTGTDEPIESVSSDELEDMVNEALGVIVDAD